MKETIARCAVNPLRIVAASMALLFWMAGGKRVPLAGAVTLDPSSIAAGYSLKFSSNLASLPSTALPEPHSMFLVALLGAIVHLIRRGGRV